MEPRDATERWDGEDVGGLARRWGVPHLEAYRTLGSTNDRARELAEAGCASWTTVVTDAQARGRGRGGSTWLSDAEAGVLLSTVVRDVDAGGPLGLWVGLACAEAVEARAPSLEVGLKWPNDLIVDGRKVGGILCEVAGDAVVVGIGINVSSAPDPGAVDRATGFPPAALETLAGKTLARNALVGTILGSLKGRLKGATSGGDVLLPDEVFAEIRHRDVLAGRSVVTDQAGEGRAAGIDATGALRLATVDGREVRIVSGGVRLSSTADARPSVSDPA